MSQEVDERVVEMRFDNAQFEKNVHQTMQSLEKLNDSLRLDGAEKGFEKISDASAKVDFDEMQGALDNLNGKFSAVEVMGVAALSHITRQAVDTGEKLVKSLSLDQVTSGWNKYAQKTASVQTIMNATGKSIAKVNGYLEKLMWFSDETSYSFTDMTQSLGQLTASGGDIEKVIPMIMGMANATAYAGKGASEFSRVIYNLNQSYSQGYLSLMDWKSVELAGVATAELKKQIIETGVALGKIKEGDVTVGTFSSTLSKKWADKEVMETAFGKFAEFSEAVKKMVDANPGMLASQAIDALADQYDEVTVKAFKAAQEAKSFSEAVDATKDAVSSGWMETFDILFGNYEEAKGFWSDLAEEFWNMFAGGAAGRNNWLKSAFDSGLDQLLGTEGFGEAGDNYTNLLQKALVNQGLLSEEGIEEAGSFQKALEESGVTAQQLYEVLGEAAEHYHQRAAMSDKELDKLGFDRDKVDALANAYDSMAEQIQNGSVNLDDLAGNMNQLSGREHFFNGILNVLEGINSVLSPIRDGFGDVFMTDGSPLYNFLKGFDELTGKMALSEETAEKVQKVFTGVFRVLSIGLKGVKAVGKTAFMILGKLLDLLSPMSDLLLNIGSCIGNLLTWVDESLGQAESLSDVLGILVGAVAALVSPIADVVKGVKTLVRGGNMEEAKKQFGAFGTVVDAVGSVLDKFKIGSVSAGNVIGTAFQLLGDVFGHELGFHFGTTDFIHFQRELTAKLLAEVAAQLFDFHALAADDDTGTGSGQDQTDLATGAFDFDLGQPRMIQELLHIGANLAVFKHKGRVVLLAEPAGLPVLVIPKPESVRMNFLTHDLFLPFCEYHGNVTGTLVDVGGAALGARHEPLPGRAFVHQNFLNDQSIHVHAGVVFRVGEGRTDHTENDAGGLIRREAQQVHGSLNRHTLHVAGDQPGLARRNAHEFGSSFRFHDWHPLFLGLGLLVGGMAVEGARRREFPKLVSHHVFGDENGQELLAVVHGKGDSHHFGQDGGPARPGLHHTAVVGFDGRFHLFHQMVVHEGTFFQ